MDAPKHIQKIGTHPEDLEHHKGSQSVSINTGIKHKSKSTPSQPSQPTTRTNPPTQPSCNGSDDHLTADWVPTETSRNFKEMSSKDNVCKISNGASNKGGQ